MSENETTDKPNTKILRNCIKKAIQENCIKNDGTEYTFNELMSIIDLFSGYKNVDPIYKYKYYTALYMYNQTALENNGLVFVNYNKKNENEYDDNYEDYDTYAKDNRNMYLKLEYPNKKNINNIKYLNITKILVNKIEKNNGMEWSDSEKKFIPLDSKKSNNIINDIKENKIKPIQLQNIQIKGNVSTNSELIEIPADLPLEQQIEILRNRKNKNETFSLYIESRDIFKEAFNKLIELYPDKTHDEILNIVSEWENKQ